MTEAGAQTTEDLTGAAIAVLRQPGFGEALWQLLHHVARPDNMVVLAYRDAGPPLMLLRKARHPLVFQRLETTYLAGAYRLDPYYALHLGRAGDGVYRLGDIAPDAFRRSRYFSDYFAATPRVDEVAFVTVIRNGVSLNLCLGRDGSSGRAFSATELAACRHLAPVALALARAEWGGVEEGNGRAEDTPSMLISAAGQHGIALTPRQATVALMILRGHSSSSIALTLSVSPQTVKVFRKQLYARCEISSQAELFSLMLPMLNAGAQLSTSSPALGRGSVGIMPVAR